MPLEGGAPREIAERVREVDWAPDGSELAVIHDVNGKDRLEFPPGKVLAETGGYFSNPRFSRKGDRIAFFEHPIKYDDRGSVAVVDLAGKKTTLSDGYWGEEGLAWSADGSEVLFSAGAAYNNFDIYAVTLDGKRRTALQSAGGLTLHDIAPDGRWIATRDDEWRETSRSRPRPGPRAQPRLARSVLHRRAHTGRKDPPLLRIEREHGGELRDLPAPDRRLAGREARGRLRLRHHRRREVRPLRHPDRTRSSLIVYPTGAGQPRKLERGGLVSYETAQLFPDGKSVFFCGHEAGRAIRCYVQEIDGGKPRPVTPDGTTDGLVSPDGRQLLVRERGGGLQLYSVEGGPPRQVPGAIPEDTVIRWTPDGRALLVSSRSDVPARVERLDLSTGRRELFKTLGPADLTGVLQIAPIAISDDGKSHAYSCRRMTSHLFLVGGAR